MWRWRVTEILWTQFLHQTMLLWFGFSCSIIKFRWWQSFLSSLRGKFSLVDGIFSFKIFFSLEIFSTLEVIDRKAQSWSCFLLTAFFFLTAFFKWTFMVAILILYSLPIITHNFLHRFSYFVVVFHDFLNNLLMCII